MVGLSRDKGTGQKRRSYDGNHGITVPRGFHEQRRLMLDASRVCLIRSP